MAKQETSTQPQVPAAFDAKTFIAKHGTKSAAIRALTAQGKDRSEVSKLLDIKYQHVRNVLITPIKKAKVVKEPTGRVGTEEDMAGL